MSLEQAINRNSELLEQLIGALSGQPLISKAEQSQAAEAKTKPAATETKVASKVKDPKPAETKEEPTTVPLTYQDTAALVIRVSNEVSRDRTVAILTGFGLKTLKDAKPEQWAGIVAECQAALKEAA